MRIIIAGAGDVGTHLAKLLSRENMDITLLDEHSERLGTLEANYDILEKVGNPTSIQDLKDCGIQHADLFVAVTPEENTNMTACILANRLGAKKTLARIDNYEYLLEENRNFFKDLGLNHLIYPEVLAANEICESLKTNWLRYHLSLCGGALELCVVKIREGAEVIGKRFDSGYFSHGRYRIVAIKRDNHTLIPSGADEVEVEDVVYVVCIREEMDFMRTQMGKSVREMKNIFFIGGSRIAQKTIQQLPDDMNIKLIEPDKDICYKLSEKLGNALIINADGSDMEMLREEGIQDADAVVAVAGKSEANIFACLAAKRFGVRKTIAEVENIDYIPMAEGLDIETVLNKKTITASYIYQMLLDTNVLNVKNLTNADAQVVEFLASEKSRITKGLIKDMHLPKDANIGGIVRAKEGILVNGDTQVLPGDKVVVFCKSEVIRQLDKFFKD
ncbi:MAG: Trk system potassium transporter TrkA [Paludibacteraceae bacterium]|nr:Trk system potassium transporter TrkA [Paludibacteraceae bacterium]